jgi:hypothetical protein
METPSTVAMSTPIEVFNPATITLAILSLLIIPAFLFTPANLIRWFELKKYQYEVTFSLYMLTPTEKFIFSMTSIRRLIAFANGMVDSILFLLISIMLIAGSLYLPDHLATIARRVYYYVSGTPP